MFRTLNETHHGVDFLFACSLNVLEHHLKLSCYVRNHDCLIHPSCSGFTGFVLTVFFSSPVTFTITSALSSKFFIYFFLNTNFPSCTDHPHMTPNPVSGILSNKRPLMSFTVMVVRYSLLVLFAQLVIFIPTLILNLAWFSSCPCSGPRPVLAVDNVLVFSFTRAHPCGWVCSFLLLHVFVLPS